eukprot:5824407-Pyramimonas_sp.AAC.1
MSPGQHAQATNPQASIPRGQEAYYHHRCYQPGTTRSKHTLGARRPPRTTARSRPEEARRSATKRDEARRNTKLAERR